MVGNASVVEAYRDFGDKNYYFRLQIQWGLLGLLFFIFFSLFDYRRIAKFANLALVISFVFLILVLIPGFGNLVYGARRWLAVGIIRFQPGELVKLTLCLFLSSHFAFSKKFLPFVVVFLVTIFLVMLEPDLGTTLIICAIGMSIYFASNSPITYIISLFTASGLLGSMLILFSPYRRERLLTFLDPMRDPLGASYHIRQALIAIGSGGIFGLGLGQSRQKYEYLPMASTDSIFAVIAEELGFVGGVLLILLFLFIIWKGFNAAKKAGDDFGRYLATGLTAWIGSQTILNLGAMLGVFPLTGIPLPFVSYGGSSLLLLLTSAGILVNISSTNINKETKHKASRRKLF